MNRGQFLRTAILLPVCFAVILSVAFYFGLSKNEGFISPVKNGARLSYFDDLEHKDDNDDVINAVDDLTLLKANDNIGEITIGKSTSTLRYNAEFSYQQDSISIMPQSVVPGDIGCVYVYAFDSNITPDDRGKGALIDGVFGKHNYAFVDEMEMNSVDEVMMYSPDCGKSLVLYCQNRQGAGYTNTYTAFIYKEVE